MDPAPLLVVLFSIIYMTSTDETFSTSNSNDDLGFADENIEWTRPSNFHREKLVPVERQWGVPDVRAVVGRIFRSQIPSDAFAGNVDHFEIFNEKGKTWPKWLNLSKTGFLKGVPFMKDVGEHYLVIKAVGPHGIHNSKDIFAIEVLKPGLDNSIPSKYKKDECISGVDPILLSIIIDATLSDIEPTKRIMMIENLAGYYGLSPESIYLHEQSTPHDLLSLAQPSFFIGGPGSKKMFKNKEHASLSFQIGCGLAVKDKMRPLLDRINEESKDGTLAEVLQCHVVGWHARSELPAFFRDRRDAGSGDFYEEEEEEEDYNEGVTTMTSMTSHPHRHHHGEQGNNIDNGVLEELHPSEVHYQRPSTSLLFNYDNILSTPPFIPERPTISPEGVPITTTFSILPTKVVEFDLPSSVTVPQLASLDGVNETLGNGGTNPFTMTTNGVFNASEIQTELTSDSTATMSLPTSNFSHINDIETIFEQHGVTNTLAQINQLNVTWTPSTSTSTTEDELESESKNFPPTIAHRLKKIAIVAGKVLRFTIPENTFQDVEDGNTSHLTITFKTIDDTNVPFTSWIAFNSSSRQIVALPLEEHVSKWEFLVEAKDKDGDTVSDSFELQVQQHKGTRTVNHEFTISLTVNQGVGFTRTLDWEFAVIDALVRIYGDSDSSHITVRAASITSDPMSFTWTNDTLPRNYCPREMIDRLFQVLSTGEDGYPSNALQEALGMGITARRVSFRGIENCESKVVPSLPPPKVDVENFAPLPRNQIDQINASIGQLLVFKVPEDTFYDPEEGGTRGLKMTLLNMDSSALDSTHWLQFDSKNQEFYGVPMDSDGPSRQEYQLRCEDQSGLTANDGLVVVVNPRADPLQPTVQFTMAIDIPYSTFSATVTNKRRFIEKLQQVFEDPNMDHIVIASITQGSTVISWFNTSLRTDYCPDEEIQLLKKRLINENEVMNERFVSIMASGDFPVISVGLDAAGWCLGEQTVHHKPEIILPSPGDDSQIIVGSDDYLITFVIPAVIIAIMLILAALVACFFYRRRRVNKMGIGDEDERQSFRNKGIPVIFQDELEEKPEPENKNPVIMKEEKPPLPPPEYQRSLSNSLVSPPAPSSAQASADVGEEGGRREQRLHAMSPPPGADDAPYHPPPPPFPVVNRRDAGRNARPKPTPTYRKPPPYVPP